VTTALGWLVLGLVFLDELLAGASMWDWGWHHGGHLEVVLAVLLTVATIAVWATFASPKARYGGGGVRPAVKVAVFCLASAALWQVGHHGLAVAFLVLSGVVNGLAQLPAIRSLDPAPAR
jgi:NADH:ubiquinone oxidoreductase subunit 4 (subunit M)